ncbi:hypothetical protein BN8_00003 [Fibrisoma limi BUZ 3]|uniref:DUF3108 domain-containing protein n=1 Tax=Fibrisoma limi BUZ 3 TaxID=1185876 RepID=I2GB26_9BACT|nr:DUF3108 domain-containing protein [Fibrisoma limi]CCH51098.1 hypothetical protein BN8_00003 [Fibrisoma limi BUZ 3]
MKKFLLGIGVLTLIATGFSTMDTYRRVVNNSFGPGEHIEYRVHYGFLNAAEAIVDVSPTLYKVNERPCYRVNVDGRTVGAFALVTKVRDTWRSYIDTNAILPQKFYTSLRENNYRKEENITFNHLNNTVRAEERTERDVFHVPDNVHDVVSSYYFVRTIDFSKLNVGQVVEVPAFYDDTIYNMKVKYRGKDVIKTKFGRINVLKLTPIMPPNSFFKGDDAIKIWVSDDANKIPLKVEVELAIGSLDMDIRHHAGLKHPLRFF